MTPLRVCLVYDCLFPWTVGGAERWYRAIAERLAATGHEVTYLTLRQWPPAAPPAISGVRVVAVGPRLDLYLGGRRRVWPPLRFGVGVWWHLCRHGTSYDVVHTAAFPYFSLLAAAAAGRRGRYRLVVDWWEVWTPTYWRAYLGWLGGLIGWLVQRGCIRVDQRAFCFSQLQARRLRRGGLRGEPVVLGGVAAEPPMAAAPEPAEPIVLFAGRLIPDKRVTALVPALAEARRTIPDLRALIVGDGPERPALIQAITASGLADAFDLPGFVDEETLDLRLRRALCLVLPSRREGYGLVVVEAAARGVPSVVVRGPDNAATELIEEGVNGFVAPTASASDLAAAILRVHAGGGALRASTAAWFAANAGRLSLSASLPAILAAYGLPPPVRRQRSAGGYS
jgi:glycosyltransferase involved in cell wall biosynthesis